MEKELQLIEIFSAWEAGEITTPLAKAAYLAKATLRQTKELTSKERSIFAWEVEMAKIQELKSYCQNEAFEIRSAVVDGEVLGDAESSTSPRSRPSTSCAERSSVFSRLRPGSSRVS